MHKFPPKNIPIILFAILFSNILYVSIVMAQVSGISYTFSPIAEKTYWNTNSGLKSNYLAGGSIGLGFGQLLEIHGSYMFGLDQKSRLINLQGGDDVFYNRLASLPDFDVNVERFSISSKLNLSTSAIVPYFVVGTGIMRLGREDLRNSDSIFLTGGAGLMASIASRYSIFVQANRFGYSNNPGASFLSGSDLNNANLQSGNFKHVNLTQWNVQLGLKAYLGGRSSQNSSSELVFLDESNGGYRNVRFTVNPVYGQMFLDESIGLPSTQHIVGVNAGLEIGPHFGVEGFYWRGLDAENTLNVEDLHFYGSEIKARFFRTDVTPFLSIGGGYMSARNYETLRIDRPEDQFFALIGAGLEVFINESISVSGALKSFMTTSEGVDNSLAPSQIKMGTMFTLGLRVRLGSNPNVMKTGNSTMNLSSRNRAQIGTSNHELTANDRTQISQEIALTSEISQALSQGDSTTASRLMFEREQLRSNFRSGSNSSDYRLFTLPVLDDGEIYIRFGKPAVGSPFTRFQSLDNNREQTESSDQAPRSSTSVLTSSELDERLDRFERRLLSIIESRTSDNRTPVVVSNTNTPEISTPTPETSSSESDSTREIEGVSIYTGLATPLQGLLGARVDYGSVLGGQVDLQPEFVLGFGSGSTMFQIMMNAIYPLDQVDYIDPFKPYVGLGFGLLAYNNPPGKAAGIQFAGSIILGAEYEYGPGYIFAEYNSINLFSFNRLNIGYRYPF